MVGLEVGVYFWFGQVHFTSYLCVLPQCVVLHNCAFSCDGWVCSNSLKINLCQKQVYVTIINPFVIEIYKQIS